MSGLQALTLENSRLAASQPHKLTLVFTITAGAPTQLLTKNLPPVVFGVATGGDLAQGPINALLEKDSNGEELSASSTSEIDASVAFGSTAMGVDAFGFVIACDGQVDEVLGMEATLYDAEQDNFVPKATSLPDTLTEGLLVTPAGNLAGRVIPTGLDAETGYLALHIYFYSK